MIEKSTIRILYTSDLHGHILPINYSDNKPTKKGFLKVIEGIQDLLGDQTILIDLGDTIQGSPLMYFHQLNGEKYENPVAQVMNIIPYDYFIPGNHDFNYGKDYLFDFTKSIKAKTLCQNIYEYDQLLFQQGFDIREFLGGFKILIIGVTTKYIPNWENPANIENMAFKDAFEEAKRIVDIYKEKVDVIVCAYHGGLEKDLDTGNDFVKDTGENQGYRMFTEIPEIDVLLTGHQHRNIAFKKGNRVVLQPSCYGSHLGIVEIEYDQDNKVTDINPKVVSVSEYSSNKVGRDLIQDIERDNQVFLDEIIGEVIEGDLEIKDTFLARRDKHSIVGFINDIQMEATGAMISSTSLANVVSGFKKNITIRNVLSTYIYSNTLAVVRIKGSELREYLEKCAEYFVIEKGEIKANPRFSYPKLEHYNYDMLDGIDYVFNLRNPFGKRVVSVKYKNSEIKDSDQFTLALNNYRASGGGDFEMLKNLPVIREIPFDVAELMIDYIRKHRFLRIKPKNNIILLK